MGPDLESLSFDELRETLIADPATSYWLRSAIEALSSRDPVDVENDAILLSVLARKKSESVASQFDATPSSRLHPHPGAD